MIQDLHSHTYYSFCGKDKPETVVEKAIESGITLLGICDHNYGIGQGRICVMNNDSDYVYPDYERSLQRYFDHINLVKEKYADKITVLRGIELATENNRLRVPFPTQNDIGYFDYCLIEHVDCPNTTTKGNLFKFCEKIKCTKGIAHTDLFKFINTIGEDPFKYFKRMADENIFWEINVNYDSIHNFREHGYVKRFFEDNEQQQIVKESGVKLSVGFDGHNVEDYCAERIANACKKIEKMGIPLVFNDKYRSEL